MPRTNPGQSPTHAFVDLANLKHNLRVLKQQAGRIGLFGVVKANAYGHGAVEVSRALKEEGVEGLAVATVLEAIALRQAGIAGRILVFGAPRRESIEACVSYELEPFVTSVEALDIIRQAGKLRVHLHIDTGMGRLGIQPGEVSQTLRELEGMPQIEIAGISTHFATAGDPGSAFARTQWATFARVLKELGSAPAPVHLASSGALFTIPDSIDPDIIGFARPGIALYGLLDLPKWQGQDPFRPVMTLVSEVAQVKTVPPDTPISYDGRWRSRCTTRIATVSAGYADGYPRNLTNKGIVSISGQRYPVVGTVCMDLFMVDLGPGEAESPSIRAGDPVILFGKEGPSAVEIALLAETIPYELVCRVNSRVERVYTNATYYAEGPQ